MSPQSVFRILPAVANFWMIVTSLSYFFAMIGMDMYGGADLLSTLSPRNPRLAHLPWRAVASVLNFDDVVSALLTMFEVATVVSARVHCAWRD